jgi:hypothetical protein
MVIVANQQTDFFHFFMHLPSHLQGDVLEGGKQQWQSEFWRLDQ